MGQVGVFSRGQVLTAGELALYSDGGSGWCVAASTMAPMWDRWNRQATRCTAGPPTHAHYVPAPSGHLGQCFSLGVLLEPEDSCLGCGQHSYSLMFLPPSLLFCLLTHHHQGHRKLFLAWGNPTPIVFLPQILSPLPFNPTAKPLSSLNREFQNTQRSKRTSAYFCFPPCQKSP